MTVPANLNLGQYVVLKPRKDGTCRALFQVPARLRPIGWAPTIPLPLDGERTGDLNNTEELAACIRDARVLYERLQRQRPPERSFAALVQTWRRSSAWHDLKPRTRAHYQTYINTVLQCPGDPARLTRSEVEAFLSRFNSTPTTKRHVLKALRIVMGHAVNVGWRPDNPCLGIRVKLPKTRVAIWEQADVDLYVACALKAGMRSIALVILLEWEIGQRLTDVRGFRRGVEYDPEGLFSFEQSKTDEPVSIPISTTLRDLLNDGEAELLFRNERTGKAYSEQRLSKTFGWVRKAAVKSGGRFLLLKWLRHSCIVQLARAGCTIPEIASITGHATSSVARILSIYLPRDNRVAWAAQTKRGLVPCVEAPTA